MVSYDNASKKIGEINVIVRPDGGTITTNTIYDGTGRVVIQHVSTRDSQGNTTDRDFFGGKVLP